jgi:hypothetical protein
MVYRAQPVTVRVSPDLVDRAVAAQQSRLSSMLDAREQGRGPTVETGTTTPIRGERFVPGASNDPVSTAVRGERFIPGASNDPVSTVVRGERFIPGAAPAAPAIGGERFIEGAPSNPVVTSSGTGWNVELDWSQLGIGVGMGLLLALGLYLAVRVTRIRPLAH